MYLDEFDLELRHIPGKENVLGDCFSRLPRMDRPVSVGDDLKNKYGEPKGTFIDFNLLESPEHEDVLERGDAFFSIDEDNDVIECLLNLPALDVMPNPINMQNIRNHQQQDQNLLTTRQRNPIRYPIENISGVDVITYREEGVKPNQWKIVLPSTLINDVVKWYHHSLGHPGTTRLYDTIAKRFFANGLYTACKNYVCPDNCHQWKNTGQGYGHLPQRIALATPWDECAVDLVGPWSISAGGQDYVFNALTCIDPVTNLVELIRIDRKTAEHVGRKFENAWLSRYPCPNRCVHDQGNEFIGRAFQQVCTEHSIKSVPTTVKNPSANGLCERMHKTILDILRVYMRTATINCHDDAKEVMDDALATMMHATRCAVNHTMQNSPGEIVYGRDMFLDIPVIADLEAIQQRRQLLINQNLVRMNRKRFDHHYKVGDLVMIKKYDPRKGDERLHGPYPILETRTNGTIVVHRDNLINETYNIRKVEPYRGE